MGPKSGLEFETALCKASNNLFRYKELRKAFDALIVGEED